MSGGVRGRRRKPPPTRSSPESMSDAVRSLQEYIKKDAGTYYDLESYAADGIGTENIDDLMKIFLSDRKRQRITTTDSGEWKNYSADFNASYGWESVLVKMFKILGVYLANGSQLDISIDTVSYTHLPSPRDGATSRMPSSA